MPDFSTDTTHDIAADERGLVVACPHCGQPNRLPYERLGQSGRCGKCHQDLSPPGEPIDAPNEAVFDAAISRSALPVLVDFWAAWCGPCKMIAPEVAKAAAAGAGRWLTLKVDTEALPALAQRYRVQAIPLLAVFKTGREVAQQPGMVPAAAIREFVERAR